MDFEKIMGYFNTALSLLTKLLVGLGVLEDEDNTPYGEYIEYFEKLAGEVKDALKK